MGVHLRCIRGPSPPTTTLPPTITASITITINRHAFNVNYENDYRTMMAGDAKGEDRSRARRLGYLP